MPKITNDDNIKEKLEYIGLNLDNIPKFLINQSKIDYKPIKAYEDNGYRVYKYIPVSKIKILLTPTNRLNSIKEKYSKASNLKSYLKPEAQEDIVRHTTFLKMLKNIKIEEIEELIKEQEELNNHIPFQVKFEENYLWQIYYSDTDDTYFMIVPTEDLEYASFFYLLKKQIEYNKTKKEQMIFVPISYENYSNEFLKNGEISDIEKYLWFFTKNWSKVYEVYDKDNNLSLHIVGETLLYENIKCIYKNKLNNKEDALKFYKFLKAMFILNTELPNHYKFQVSLNRFGSLEFKYLNRKITYDNMFNLLTNNYEDARKDIIFLEKQKRNLKDEVLELKELSTKYDEEYLLKEKEIATYLECRKTFFGKVKYFFKLKKKRNIKNDSENKGNKDIARRNDSSDIEDTIKFNIKDFYTVDDIVQISKELDKINADVKNLNMDKTALESKIENVKTKIKNANLYIEEIDKHEKSIFEFWKFANKDENLMLNVGTTNQNITPKKIEKVYNYLEDKEEIGTLIDKAQREILTKEEMDCVYIATQYTAVLNKIENNDAIKESLEDLKMKLENERILFKNDKVDIFGGITDDNTKLKVLGTKKHREVKKDDLKILDIVKDTSIKEYKNKLIGVINNIRNAINKKKNLISIPVYISIDDGKELNGLQICELNVEDIIEQSNKEQINICRIDLKEDTKVIYFSNSIYYDNYNKTLPLGMDISDKCLIDLNMYELKQVRKAEFRVTKPENEFKIQSKKILLKEYELEEKDDK